jgi:hypothetical protein
LYRYAQHLQKKCAERSAAYLACKKNNQNPAVGRCTSR